MTTRPTGRPLAARLLATRALTVFAVTLVTIGAAVTAPVAEAQTTSGVPKLTLVGQDAWTRAGGDVTLRLSAENVPPGLTLALATYDQVRSRSAFDAMIEGGPAGTPIDLMLLPFDGPYDGLTVDPVTGNRVLRIGLDDLNARLNTAQASSGVFPLVVELRDGNSVVSGFVTHLVVAAVTDADTLVTGQPLSVAWVWPLVAEPAYRADGKVNAEVAAELQPDGRFGRQAGLLAMHPDVPVTLAPSPETLASLTTLSASDPGAAAVAAQLRSTASDDQVLGGPFVPLDIPSLAAGGLLSTVPGELDAGVRSLEEFFGGRHIDPSTALPGPLNGVALTALRDALRRRLVVEGSALTAGDEQFTQARPATVLATANDGSSEMSVLASDEGIERILTGDVAPALRAARVLAALSVIAGELPSRVRGVAIINPTRWDAPTELVNGVFAGLQANPLLQPVTVDALLANVPPATVDDNPDGPRVPRQLAPVEIVPPPVSTDAYVQAINQRKAIVGMFGEDDPRVEVADRSLLTALSASWSSPEGRRGANALLTSIRRSVDGFLSRVHVPSQSTVTLTSTSAEVPITFDNDTGQPVRVRIRLESDRLLFPDGAERVVELPLKNHTERIRVETRGPGTFPISVEVTTEGGLPIAKTRLRVRSSFVSGVGIVLVIGALAFLALWWGWDIQRRRKRRARDDATRATAPVPA